MSVLNGGQLVAKMLKREGVEAVFTLTGGHIMPILYACTDEGIDVIDVRHECTAAYAADAYARVTGKPGVVITTAGPGVTDTYTAMAESADAGIPVIHIGGGTVQSQNDMGAAQNIDTVSAMAVFCRSSRKCLHTHRIPEYVGMAFREAMDDTPGPVYLELPMDILYEKFNGAVEESAVNFPLNYRTEAMAFGDPAYIEQAAALLAEAKKPVMVLGEQSRYTADYGEAIKQLVDYLKMPVLSTPLSVTRGVFANEADNELFSLGEAAAAQADVILELACNNLGHISFGKAPFFNAEAKVIQIHPDKTKIGFNARMDIGIVAGAGAAAKQLLEAVKNRVPPRADESWVEEARQLTRTARAPFIEAKTSDIVPIHPGRLAAETAKFLEQYGQDWHVICDGGDAAQWILYNAVARYPGQVIKFGNLGTIGAGTGYAIGAWAADKKPVLYYTGDGSFGFYSMEMETMARFGIPVVCVISNDSQWGMIKLSQEIQAPEMIKARGGHHSANLLHPMREYEKLPALWGGTGVQVTAIEDVVPAIEQVWRSGKPGVVNCQIDDKAFSPRTESFAGKKTKSTRSL